MEDLYYAGRMPVVLRELGERGLLHEHTLSVNGRSIWENVQDAACWNREVVTPFAEPFKPDSGMAILRGNLAPKGAVIKPSAAPPALMREGGRDMIRISDARMSGTAYGTVVLHVAPEAVAGGPLELVRNGDLITLDVAARTLQLHDTELAARRAAWTPPPSPYSGRGYTKMFVDHVLQADRGADLDFLVSHTGSPVPRDNH